MLNGFDRVVSALEKILSLIAAVTLAALMLIIVVDIMMRYVFHSPLQWAYDMTSMYIVVIVFFFAMSDSLRENVHLSIESFRGRWAPRTEAILDLIALLLTGAVVSVIAWKMFGNSYRDWLLGSVTSGLIQWQTWISWAIGFIGLFVFLLRCLQMIMRSIVVIYSGIDSREANEGRGAS